MRLDHLLSKEESRGWFIVEFLMTQEKNVNHRFAGKKSKISSKFDNETSSGDAIRGHTRSHPEHDG